MPATRPRSVGAYEARAYLSAQDVMGCAPASLAARAHQIALQELVDAVRTPRERIVRIAAAIEEFLPGWSLAPVVRALQTLRGMELIVAVTFVTEIGDMRRFDSPRQLMGYLGLVPSERSTGDTIRRGGITKAGNGRVRHMLVESAWTYRHPPRVGKAKLYRLEHTTPKVREIAWKAQSRLTARYRALIARGKKTTVVRAAIARELAGCICSAGDSVPVRIQKRRVSYHVTRRNGSHQGQRVFGQRGPSDRSAGRAYRRPPDYKAALTRRSG